jgi:hypothetical protein
VPLRTATHATAEQAAGTEGVMPQVRLEGGTA